MKGPKCALIPTMRIIYFPLGNIAPEIALCICCNKPVLFMLYTREHSARGHGLEAKPRAILASQPRLCAIFVVVHSLRYFNNQLASLAVVSNAGV